MGEHRVAILVFPGFQTLDAVGPFEVFASSNEVVKADAAGQSRTCTYDPRLLSMAGGMVTAGSGLAMMTEAVGNPAGIDTLVIAGGAGVDEARRDPELLSWVREAASSVRRVVTVCTGTFVATSAGLLTDRRVTTHWARAQQLERECPDLEVDCDPIYIRDGKFWSSAGVTAGMDLALALVEADLGMDVAQTVARWLVMFMHRPGGQSQFAESVWTPRAQRSAIRSVQEMVETAPQGDHTLARMAAAASMSVRHFARVFREEVGDTPARYVERVRVDAARRQLEESDLGMGAVASCCGLGSAETLRRVFHKHLGVAPDDYRRRFRHRQPLGV